MALLADRYELREPLGSGAMSEVVSALDTRLGRTVAIKLIRQALLTDPTSRERLLREARSAAALHHPNSVAVYDVGEDSGRPFIVMEFVQGQTLADRLRERGPLTADESVEVGSALLSALEAAHDRGLIHRDVKPANVLLSTGGTVKLADFGIAKALDATDAGLTGTGLIIGTPRYLAPEVAAGQEATFASDLYSLSAVLFECLSGRPPFDGPTPMAVAMAHERAPVPSLAELAPQIPPSLVTTVERGLSKDPAHRFAGAREMRATLTAGGGEVASGRPSGPPGVGVGPAGTQVLDPEDGAGTQVSGAGDGVAGVATQDFDPQGDAATQVSGSGGRASIGDPGDGTDTKTSPSRVPVGWIAAAVVVALLLAIWGVAQLLPGANGDEAPPTDDGTEQGDTPAEDGPADDPDGDDPAPAEEAPGRSSEAPGQANSPDDALDELIAAIARDPDAAGERGQQLQNGLEKVRRQEDSNDRDEEARKLVKEIAEWLDDDRLDSDVGQESVAVLEAVSRPEDPDLHDVSALFAEIAVEREAWGDKAKDLLEDLADLLGEEERGDQLEDARDISEEIDEWVAGGELDADRGRAAQTILRDL